MKHAQDFDVVVPHTVGNDVRQAPDYEFVCPKHASGPAQSGVTGQQRFRLVNQFDGLPAPLQPGLLTDVRRDVVEVASGWSGISGNVNLSPIFQKGYNLLGHLRERAVEDSSPIGLLMTQTELARLIDHTLLKPDATREQVLGICDEARRFGFAAVCIAPFWVPVAVKALTGAVSKVAAVIGFPHGNTLSEVKAFEALRALEFGASELDMVINIGALKDHDYETVRNDIAGVVDAARRRHGTVVKVIIETALLTQPEKVVACEIAERAGANFVKTSTGFALGGAKLEDVHLMRTTVGDRLGVKASGGIRDLATALSMLDAGANRLGCSASVAIIEEMNNERTQLHG